MFIIFGVAILVAILSSLIGCFAVWKKYSYFSDSLAHATMFAGVISSVLPVNSLFAAVINAMIFSFFVFYIQSKEDRALSITVTSNIFIALSILIYSLYPNIIDLQSVLFGNIINTSINDIYIILAFLLIVVVLLYFYHKDIFLYLINDELAKISGTNIKLLEFLFITILSITIMISIKIVGVLLVTTIMIIPAIIANCFSNSPFSMIFNAIMISIFITILAFLTSIYFNILFTPIVAVIGIVLFAITKIYSKLL